MWTDTDVAYLAGLIDGEGHIAVYPNRTSANRENTRSFVANFYICGTDETLIKWVADMFDGTFSAVSFASPDRKVLYRCRWSYAASKVLLPVLIPYIKLKRVQAEVYLEYLTKYCRKAGRKLTEADRDAMENLVARCWAVNNHHNTWRNDLART